MLPCLVKSVHFVNGTGLPLQSKPFCLMGGQWGGLSLGLSNLHTATSSQNMALTRGSSSEVAVIERWRLLKQRGHERGAVDCSYTAYTPHRLIGRESLTVSQMALQPLPSIHFIFSSEIDHSQR